MELDTFAVGEAEAREAYTFADDTVAQYEEMGVAARPRPFVDENHTAIFPGLEAGSYYDGRMPPALKQLTLDEVSSALCLSCNWLGYISAQYALVAASRSEAKKRKEAIWSIVRNNYRKIGKRHGVNFTDQKLSDFARGDSRFVSADAEYEKLNAMYATLEALVDVTKKEMETISREVTIRQAKVESEARGRGISRRFVDPSRAGLPERGVVNGPLQNKVPSKIQNKPRLRPRQGAK